MKKLIMFSLMVMLTVAMPVFGAGVTLFDGPTQPTTNVVLQFLPDAAHTTGTLNITINDGVGDEHMFGQSFPTGDAFLLEAISFMTGKDRDYGASQVLEVAILDNDNALVAGPFSCLCPTTTTLNWVTLTFDEPVALAAATSYRYVYTLIGPLSDTFDCYGDRNGGFYTDGRMVSQTYAAGSFPTVASPNLAGRDMYFILHENTGVNMPPEVNPTATPPAPADPANPLLSEGIHMINDIPTSAQLNAGAADTDDLAYAWTIISQPVSSIATLDDAAIATPVITVDTLGDYVLEVSVDDATNPAVTAQVTVTALDNQAPNADVLGNLYDRTLYYDEVIRNQFDAQQLEAGFQDDGDPCLVVTTWSDAGTGTGTGTIIFQDGPNAKDPNAIVSPQDPSIAGTYVLQLDATDGVYDDLTPDTITITVLANIDPVADAGEATALISLAAPDSGILDLNGVVEEDDGYPHVPGAMTIEWTADDPLIGFGDPALAVTTANFNTAGEGTYVLTLTADDGGGNPAVDTIVVTVSKYAMAQIILNPLDDTFVRSTRLLWNMGGSNTLAIENSLETQASEGKELRLGLLKFDVNGQVPGAVESATLRMFSKDAMLEARILAMTYGPSGEWFEGNGLGDPTDPTEVDTTGVGITWDSFDLVQGPVLDFITPIADESWYEFDVLGMVMENDGKVTIGMDAPNMDVDGEEWRTKEGDEVPELIVVYYSSAAYGMVPVPDQVEVHPNATLTWNAGAGADTEEIYFGEAGSSVLVNTNTAGDPNEYDPSPAGELALGTVYEWKIISKAGGEIIGETGVRTFTVMLLHPDVPVNLSPLDLAVDVVRPVVFDFFEGEDANSTGDHNLLIGTESGVLAEVVDGVLPGHPNATLADLALDTEYFWKIEAVGTGGTYLSVETSFITEECEVVDDFEGTLAWTGAAVIETVIVDEGLQAMAINYDDSDGQDTATLSLGGADLEALNGALLHIRFHGAAGNDPELMTATISDGTNSASVVYYGDPEDIVVNSWNGYSNWYVDILSAAGTVDLSSVDSVSISVGDGVGTEAGVVYIDNITICASMCVGAMIPGQFDGEDCMGDPNELMLLAKDWLLQDEVVTGGGDVTSDLVVHFTFDVLVDPNDAVPGDEYFESSVGGATASIVGDVSVVAGHIGNAIDNSLGYVTVDDPTVALAPMGGADGSSIAFWAYCYETINSATGELDIDSSRFVSDGGASYWKLRSDGNYSIRFLNGAFIGYSPSDPADVIGNWNHLAYTADFNSDTTNFYINGELVHQNTSRELPFPDSPLVPEMLGIGGRLLTDVFDHQIDDFRVYSRALSQEEVISLAGVGSVAQELVSDADTNDDGIVNLVDFANVASIWLDEVVWP